MQIKISKTLEAIIARAAFNTTKAGLDHSLKDFLTLELLREEGSLAYQLLSSRLKDWELYQIRLRIERELRARDIPEALIASALEEIEPQEYDRNFERLFLQRVEAVGGLSSTAQVAKVYRYLLARGYDPADIWEAINVKRREKGEKP